MFGRSNSENDPDRRSSPSGQAEKICCTALDTWQPGNILAAGDTSTRLWPVEDPQWLTDAEYRAWIGYRRMRARLDLQLARDLARDSGLSEI